MVCYKAIYTSTTDQTLHKDTHMQRATVKQRQTHTLAGQTDRAPSPSMELALSLLLAMRAHAHPFPLTGFDI